MTGLAQLGGSIAGLALALLLVSRTRRDRLAGLGLASVRAVYVELAVMRLLFAFVGFYQCETRDIFQNPKVITANASAPFFRVNSVFWDPSVYGRFLVVAMLPSLVLLVLGRLGRWSVAAVAALVVMWLGLLISFSQSSFAALLVVVAAAAFVFWRWRALLVIVV